jgi:glycine/D-amino acid oxidase-like deaminating enzyme
MKTYDWIVVGAGIAGAALAYELVKKGFTVLLLEQYEMSPNATRYSYGGLAFWSGSTPLTRQLCDEGIARYSVLSQELAADIELRELDLLLTIAAENDPIVVAASYQDLAVPPKLLSIQEACELEPLLNRNAIAGALTVKHGHIHPEKTAQAYIQAFLRGGGEMEIGMVLQIKNPTPSPSPLAGRGVRGVITASGVYEGDRVVICVGGLSRQLLKASGVDVPIYFTHGEMIKTAPVDIRLRTLVMPANLQRPQLEAESTQVDELWDELGKEVALPILDAGAIQFQDGSLRLGQVSRALTQPYGKIDSNQSETWLRSNIEQVLPSLANLSGTWHHCLVAFSGDKLPLVGELSGYEGIYIFSGFSNPLVIIPPLAQRFANWVCGEEDKIITHLSPARF